MGKFFSLLVPLGLAGFDPAPVFVALFYLATHENKAGRRTATWFCLFLLMGKEAVFSALLVRARRRFGRIFSYALPSLAVICGVALSLDVALYPFHLTLIPG